MNGKTKVRLITLTIITCLLLFLVSFGYFYTSSNQSDRNRLTGGCFNTSFTDQNSISITNAMPESFDEALNEEPYEFTLSNTCSLPVKYYVLLNVKTGSFNPNYINFTMNETNYNNLSNVLENTDRFSIDSGYNKSYIIDSGFLQSGSETRHLRLWIDEAINPNDLESNSSFTAQVKVVGEVASSLGTDKIKNLVSGANTSSTDVIDKGVIGTGENQCTNTLAYDGTADNNLRYVGANPCNYVSFNNEVWRIIGVMNNIDDGTGKKETRLKLVRNKSIGAYSWDTSSSEINNGWGISDWTQADLMRELNGDYLNTNLSSNTLWYNNLNDSRTATFDYTKILNLESQSLIQNAKWYLGGTSSTAYSTEGLGTAKNFYEYERGNLVWGQPGQNCNDGYCPRALNWTGKVALIYVSDFGLAVGGDNRNICLTTNLIVFNNNNCNSLDWLIPTESNYKWFLNTSANNEHDAFSVGPSGIITNGGYIKDARLVVPTIYLKPNVSIVDGDGSPSNMFILK